MFPLDCIGHILTFNSKVGTINIFMECNNTIKDYLGSNLSWICKNIRFHINSVKGIVPKWISKLKIECLICMNDEKYLRNVTDLHIVNCGITKKAFLESIDEKFEDTIMIEDDNPDVYLPLFVGIKTDITSLRNIKKLSIDSRHIFAPIMTNIDTMKCLDYLHLDFNIDYVDFRVFRNIKTLYISCSKTIEKNDIKMLKKIEHLHVDGMMLVSCLKLLKGITSLSICISGSIENFRDIRLLSGIKYLDVRNTVIDLLDEDLKYLSGIKVLIATYTSKITDNGLNYISGIKKLVLGKCANITDKGMKYLQGIEHLEINGGEKITDDGLSFLSGIKCLILSKNTSITDNGVCYISYGLKIMMIESTEK